MNFLKKLTHYFIHYLASFRKAPDHCNIALDENLLFFNSDACRNPANPEEWIIPIHGWVYEPQASLIRSKAVETLLKKKFGLTFDQHSQAIFKKRVNWFLSDNERRKRILIDFSGQCFTCPKSQSNGHFTYQLTLPDTTIRPHEQQNTIPFNAIINPRDSRKFSGKIRLIEPSGVSVISDIDDTVKITEVTNRAKMLENTFCKPFVAVPGMAEKYSLWSQSGIAIHFVSSSPWYLYSELIDFFLQSGFPHASLSLKAFRFRDKSLLNLFKPGDLTKPKQISAILDRFPHRQFILIGDSGEQDPEVYSAMKKNYPAQIQSIWIRNITNETLDNLRMHALLKDMPTGVFHLFDSASELPETLS